MPNTDIVTVQSHQKKEPFPGGMVMPMRFFNGMDIAPSWDAADRDSYLRKFWMKFGNDMLSAVLAVVTAKIQTQNWELEGPEKAATMYHDMLRDDSDFGNGWGQMISRGVLDYYTQDNGWFMERQRASLLDHTNPMLGISHLDSARMYPTGNADEPYVYHDVEGKYHLMHRSQMIHIVDMPNPRTEKHGFEKGFCALSRTLSTSIILTMLIDMKQERLADLPPSAIAVFNNINRKQFEHALALKNVQDDAAGNMIWRQLLPLFGIDATQPAKIDFISLREVWESFDDETAYNIAAYSYAAGFRIDPREFWPVSQGPLGTGREAEIQHQKAKAKSHGLIFTELERNLNSDLSLPKMLQFRFVLQDADEEQQRAQIHSLQIANIKSMQDSGASLQPDEVRHLLTAQYKVLPRSMATTPPEGSVPDLSATDVWMDDVERQVKEFGGLYFGPNVVLNECGTKEYTNRAMSTIPSFMRDSIMADVILDGIKALNVVDVDVVNDNLCFGSKELLVTAIKEKATCCPGHAWECYPSIVEDLYAVGLITLNQAMKAHMATPEFAYDFALAMKATSDSDVLDAAAKELIRMLADVEFGVGEKETRALTTIKQKITTLDPINRRAVLSASDSLMNTMLDERRMQTLRSIPDDMWNEAARLDVLDEQLDVA